MSTALLLLLVMLAVIPAVIGDCSKSDVSIFITEEGDVNEACDIKGSEMSKEGASISTSCEITCSCKNKIVKCCYKNKCIDVKDDCQIVRTVGKDKLTCTHDVEGTAEAEATVTPP